MISLTELQQKVKKDLKINDLQLDVESLRIPSLHSQYLQLLTEHSLAYKKARNELSIIRRNKWIYYSGKASEDVYKEKGDFPIKLKTKDEEKTFIEADEEFIEKKKEVDYSKVMDDEETIKRIRADINKGFITPDSFNNKKQIKNKKDL